MDVPDADILANPYVLFEHDEAAGDRISFPVLDRGVFPMDAVRAVAPLNAPVAMSDAIDPRRVRGLVVDILEQAVANEGHTLLPRSWLVERALHAAMEPKCAADEDVLTMNQQFLGNVVSPGKTIAGEPTLKLKRYATAKTMIAAAVRRRVAGRMHDLSHPWRKLVDAVLDESGGKDKTLTQDEALAREEKTAAIEQLARSRFAVLIGPAGSGKTTLLKILCDLPEVRSSVLLLTPTGKARVRLEEATNRRGQGQTLAQFLQRWKRYDGDSRRYFWNSEAPREKSYRTVIVDECSMLTEDQLAALLDAVEGVERIVLVGDPRQLPPIGAGRPFVDICRTLAPPPLPPIFPRLARGYAELTIIGRQRGGGRGDVLLAQQFSGEPLDAGADEVWDRLREGQLDHVRAVHWAGPAVVRETLNVELVTELALANLSDEAGFEASIGATPFGMPHKCISGLRARSTAKAAPPQSPMTGRCCRRSGSASREQTPSICRSKGGSEHASARWPSRTIGGRSFRSPLALNGCYGAIKSSMCRITASDLPIRPRTKPMSRTAISASSSVATRPER